MARRYGRAPRGERLVSKVPRGHWKTITFVAALRCDRITAPAVFDGPMDRECFQAYVEQVQRTVRPGGYVLIATFAEDGPKTCSGLPVVRYSAESLHSEFGPAFRIVTSQHEDHHTPAGREQSFLYCLCRRE